MGIRCFTPVSDDRKKTETVHSLLSVLLYNNTNTGQNRCMKQNMRQDNKMKYEKQHVWPI